MKPHPHPCWNTWPLLSATFLEEWPKKILEQVGVLGLWDWLVGVEPENAALQHERGKVVHDRLSLKVEVTEHFV